MSTVSFTASDGIGTIALDRPDAGNAVNLDLARDLHDAALAAEADPTVRVVVMRGAGRNFCVGGDLKAFAAREDLPCAPPRGHGAPARRDRGTRPHGRTDRGRRAGQRRGRRPRARRGG